MRSRTTAIAAALALLAVSSFSRADGATPVFVAPAATPGVACATGSHPESMQGRAPAIDAASGRAALGYTCNATQVGHDGVSGGYRVERYVDAKGQECAYYDSDTFIGEQVQYAGPTSTGVYVMDMHDPTHPKHVTTLVTAAMQSPHESLRLNAKRGLLAASLSTVSTGPGVIDLYDVRTDCLHPALLSSSPVGVLGHESAFAPDGMTYYVSSLNVHSLAAVDISDPTSPKLVWFVFSYGAHGISLSRDGTRLYMADVSDNGFSGLTILDVSEVQAHKALPNVPVVGRLTWPSVSIPQQATPFTRGGHPYVLEVDEFGEGVTGAARLIDIADEKHPTVASDLRLQVNQPEVYDELQADPGNGNTSRGYQAHYCTLPSRVDPNIVACSFIMSGLRVFDIRDPHHPRELAYFNKPLLATDVPRNIGSFAMSAPAYDPASKDIWYSDGNTGFYVVHLVGRAAIPFARTYVTPGS